MASQAESVQVYSSIELPTTNVELVPEEEKIEDGKEAGPAFHCDLYDTEIVHKIAQALLPGLATACVDNTTGDMFRSPGSVAVDIRKEMIDYLTQRSESFVAEAVILEGGPDGEVSDHPYDIISDFIDDFSSTKRNLFSRVSGWLLSEKREDKIDDFVQEMEINGFWLTDRREAVAQTLLKNVDFQNIFHCDEKFNTAEELAEHVVKCGYRSENCENEGCTAVFCVKHMEKHDSICPFKIIPCEQNCSDTIMRREMDRHCITVCPMKLVNCPFYAVGCRSTVPKCMIQQHRSDDLNGHLLFILKGIHKEVSVEDLKQRVDQIVQASSGRLGEARDVRSLILAVKDLEAKLGPLEVKAAKEASEEPAEAANDTNRVSKAAVEKDSEETRETTNKISEESTKTENDTDRESKTAVEKDSEETRETIIKTGEESTKNENEVAEELNKTPNWVDILM